MTEPDGPRPDVAELLGRIETTMDALAEMWTTHVSQLKDTIALLERLVTTLEDQARGERPDRGG